MNKRHADKRALHAWRAAGRALRRQLYDIDPKVRRIIVIALLADARSAIDENDKDDPLARELRRSRKQVHNQNVSEVRGEIDALLAADNGGNDEEE